MLQSFSVLTGTFQRLLVLFKGFVLRVQKSFFCLSAWRSHIVPHSRGLASLFQSFLRFFRICIQEPVFCSKLPGFSGRFARFLLIYIVIKGPPCRRMHNSPFGSVLFFPLHLLQGQPDRHCQHRQHADQAYGHGTQHIVIGICRVRQHLRQCRNGVERSMRNSRYPDAFRFLVKDIQQSVEGKADHAPYHQPQQGAPR